MMALAPFVARLSIDRDTVAMRRGGWKHRIDAAELPRWIKLYRTLSARRGGKFAEVYGPPLAALERVARELAQGARA